jgi:hypothetical protein
MQAVIYIEITDELSFSYEKPILGFIKTQYSGITLYDFDNHSDAVMVKYAVELLAQADQLLIIIQARESPTNHLISFFEKLIYYQDKCKVFFDGNHGLTERMLSLVNTGNQRIKKDLSLPEKQQEIQSFFSKD